MKVRTEVELDDWLTICDGCEHKFSDTAIGYNGYVCCRFLDYFSGIAEEPWKCLLFDCKLERGKKCRECADLQEMLELRGGDRGSKGLGEWVAS